MATPRWMTWLNVSFPNLRKEEFTVVDPPSDLYNCIAYAAGDTSQWWDHTPRGYWPLYATRSKRIESLQEVFVGLGFEECDDGTFQSGYQKIVLYEDQGTWEHATIQMPNGAWRSKMGRGPVIEHRSPESLSDGPYGNPTVCMRRAVSATHERQTRTAVESATDHDSHVPASTGVTGYRDARIADEIVYYHRKGPSATGQHRQRHVCREPGHLDPTTSGRRAGRWTPSTAGLIR